MLRLVVPFTAIALMASCLGGDALGDGRFQAFPRPLAEIDPPARLGECEVLGVLQLKAPGERWFGGWSGMAMDGDSVTMVNDSGHWGRFRLLTDEAGRPMGAKDLTIAPLGGLDGSKEDGDAEELVKMPDGWVVSFERRHRLMHYPGLSEKPQRLPTPDGAAALPANSGMEAVTRLPDGELLIITEDSGDAWIGPRRLAYARHGSFNPTAAATLPDGSVLVLERSFSLLAGVAVRLVRMDLKGGSRELMVLKPPLLVDNYEALAVRRRPDGRLVAYLLSDDNFSAFQATLLMAVLLPDDAT